MQITSNNQTSDIITFLNNNHHLSLQEKLYLFKKIIPVILVYIKIHKYTFFTIMNKNMSKENKYKIKSPFYEKDTMLSYFKYVVEVLEECKDEYFNILVTLNKDVPEN